MIDFEERSRKGFSAVGTKTIIRLNRHSTKSALKLRFAMDVKGFFRFGRYPTTTITLKKWNPLFYPKKRQEKYRKVMILPLQTGLIETTRGTPPGRGINIDQLWLNSGNEKKHGPGFNPPFLFGRNR
jgi:hypothetical protein